MDKRLDVRYSLVRSSTVRSWCGTGWLRATFGCSQLGRKGGSWCGTEWRRGAFACSQLTSSLLHRCSLTAIVVASLALLPVKAHALIIASSAADICAPTTDPCVITDTVQITSGAALDFGLRAVEVNTGGELDFGGGTALLLCGSFTATTASTTAIRLRSGTGIGGNATIQARRSCSANPLLSCLTDNQCSAVAAGTCTVGSGTISLGGKVLGNTQTPGSLTLNGAGTVTLSEEVNLTATLNIASGGVVTVTSSHADVNLDGNINAEGGGLDTGGIVNADAAANLNVRGIINLRGGDFDGGIFDASAAAHINIENDILVDSRSGEGFGGDLLLSAGGDIIMTGGTAANPVLLSSNGSSDAGVFAGDGGEHSYSAGGTISIGQFVKIVTDGAIPDGTGGDITLSANTISLAGTLQSRGKPGSGSGGVVDLTAATGGVSISATGRIDVTGHTGGGGDATLLSSGDVAVSGVIDAAGSVNGGAGSIFILADASVTIDGTLSTAGSVGFGDTIAVSGCSVTVAAGGLIDNSTTAGRNTLTGRASVTIEAAATVSADPVGGSNTFIHANAALPPTIAGTVTPAATIVFDGLLPSCASCSSASQCDDSNACTDDTCDPVSGCSNTPNTLPCDDGNPCTTADVCSSGACLGQIPLECDDANPCTDDSCLADGSCVNTANSLPCDDGKLCTAVDTCTAGVCVGQAPIQCDDGDPCTQDSCDDVVGCLNPATPAPTCFVAPASFLQVGDNSKDAKDVIKWKWAKGDAVALGDLGSPDTTTGYTLCLYDSSGGVASVASSLTISAGLPWARTGNKGWRYKDKSGSAAGVRKLQLRSGPSGKTKVLVTAKGINVPTPTPVAADRFFALDPMVSVQLVNTQGRCWTVDFFAAKKNSVKAFKAKVK